MGCTSIFAKATTEPWLRCGRHNIFFVHHSPRLGFRLPQRIERMKLTGTSFPLLKGDGFQCFYHSRSSCLERFLRFPDGDSHNRAKACILESVVKKTPRQVFNGLTNLTHGVSQQGFFLRLWVMDRVVQQCHRSAPSECSVPS